MAVGVAVATWLALWDLGWGQGLGLSEATITGSLRWVVDTHGGRA